ncbi:hypothetical protein [Acrocarpospora sp. B8E8]|uniref:hypothetical protein n=1 Tax=Acrocarpospora sp. B8E8 TaxID=3153572 RepID=UPI00325EDB38
MDDALVAISDVYGYPVQLLDSPDAERDALLVVIGSVIHAQLARARLDVSAVRALADGLNRWLAEREDAQSEPEPVEVFAPTAQEWDGALALDLAELGCTRDDLKAMARTGDYASPAHRKLWLTVKPVPKDLS